MSDRIWEYSDIAAADKSDSGDTTVVSVGAGEVARIYGVAITGSTDLTGAVYVKLGSVQKTIKATAYIAGGTHWLMPLKGKYVSGAKGDDIVITNSAADTFSYAIYYRVVKA